MKKLTIASILVVALLAFSLAGCSGQGDSGSSGQSNSGSSAQTSAESIVGYWQLDPDASIVIKAYLHLEGDGSAEFVAGDSYYEGKWKVEDGSAIATFEGAESAKMSFDGEKLWFGSGSNSSRLVFAKTDDNAVKHAVSDLRGAGAASAASTSESTASANAGSGASSGSDIEVYEEVFEPIEPVAIADDANCTITVTAKGTDFTNDPCYQLTVTNKTNKALYLAAEEPFTVGGKKIDAGLGDSLDPGETVVVTMFFAREDLGGGLELLADVTGTINLEEDDTFVAVADYPFHMD